MPFSAFVPTLVGRDWWNTWDYPSQILDQCFANHLCDGDLLAPSHVRGLQIRNRTQANIASSGKSEVKNGDKEFQVCLNVSQFTPEEIKVKVVDNYIVIHGKHEEKSDEHGLVSREFTRRYMLPRSCEMDTVVSSWSPEGILTVKAPKKDVEPPQQEREIPITEESKEAACDTRTSA